MLIGSVSRGLVDLGIFFSMVRPTFCFSPTRRRQTGRVVHAFILCSVLQRWASAMLAIVIFQGETNFVCVYLWACACVGVRGWLRCCSRVDCADMKLLCCCACSLSLCRFSLLLLVKPFQSQLVMICRACCYVPSFTEQSDVVLGGFVNQGRCFRGGSCRRYNDALIVDPIDL